MLKRALALTAMAATTFGVFAAPAANAATIFTYSYESGFSGWRADSDGLADPWSITRSTKQAFHGSYSLEVFMNGVQDDGTSWVERRFTVQPNQQVTVNLRFQLWSLAESPFTAWAAVATAGAKDPEVEDDFTVVGQADLAPGWQEYTYSGKVTADASGRFWVAFGTSVRWETERTHYLDFAQVTFE
jgi:hypothetical protein